MNLGFLPPTPGGLNCEYLALILPVELEARGTPSINLYLALFLIPEDCLLTQCGPGGTPAGKLSHRRLSATLCRGAFLFVPK